jgi:membrane peptidoglycan carboxypeptidase
MSNNVVHGVSVTRVRRGRRSPVRALAPVFAVAAVASVAAAGCRYSVDLNPLKATAQSSNIVAADGALLATLDQGEHRVDVALGAMAPDLKNAVVAIEDHRYWEHPGVDVRAVLRAVQRDATHGALREGGSTITQQYVRTVMLGRERTVHRKLREAVLALQLDRRYSKRAILER